MNNECASIMISTLFDEQVSLYKELRLRALKDHRDAFMETPEAFEARPVEAISERMRESQAQGGFTLVAQDFQRGLVGTASLAVGATPKEVRQNPAFALFCED